MWWCHLCRRVVAPTATQACPVCGNDFLEVVEDPGLADFVPLDVPQQQQQQPPPPPPQQQPHMNAMQQLLDNLVRAMGGGGGQARVMAVPIDLQQLLGAGGGGLQNVMQIFGMPMGGGNNPGDFVADGNLQNVLNRLFDQSGMQTRGADAETIASLPLEQIGPADEGEECPVCKEAYVVQEEVKCMPCRHRFHIDCLDPWLKMKSNCPVCRFELKEAPGRKEGREDERPPPRAAAAAAAAAAPPPPPAQRRAASPEPPTPSDSEDDDSGQGHNRGTNYDDMYL